MVLLAARIIGEVFLLMESRILSCSVSGLTVTDALWVEECLFNRARDASIWWNVCIRFSIFPRIFQENISEG